MGGAVPLGYRERSSVRFRQFRSVSEACRGLRTRIPAVLPHSAAEIARQSLPTKFRFPDHEMERPKRGLSAFRVHLATMGLD